jgi:hypothetical protein
MVRVLLKIPLPGLTVPRVLGIDFALRRGRVYATVFIDAETGRRVDVVPGRIMLATSADAQATSCCVNTTLSGPCSPRPSTFCSPAKPSQGGKGSL